MIPKKLSLRHPLPTFGSYSFFQASIWLRDDKVLQKLTKSYKNELRHLFQCCILIPRKCPRKTPFQHTVQWCEGARSPSMPLVSAGPVKNHSEGLRVKSSFMDVYFSVSWVVKFSRVGFKINTILSDIHTNQIIWPKLKTWILVIFHSPFRYSEVPI